MATHPQVMAKPESFFFEGNLSNLSMKGKGLTHVNTVEFHPDLGDLDSRCNSMEMI